MIMELAENGTLFSYQNKQQRIGEAEAFKFFSQTLSAIQYMHNRDMMHRDIKVTSHSLSPKTFY
jgi:serine/threonine protein kinase